MFYSTHEGVLDAKGRVSVPASFRQALGAETGIYVHPTTDGSGCLIGGGEALRAHNRALLNRMAPGTRAKNSFTMAFITLSAQLNFDANGRVSLPKKLVDFAGLTDKVVFAGADDRFQIWSPERFAEYEANMMQAAMESQDKLAEPFFDALEAGELPGGPKA